MYLQYFQNNTPVSKRNFVIITKQISSATLTNKMAEKLLRFHSPVAPPLLFASLTCLEHSKVSFPHRLPTLDSLSWLLKQFHYFTSSDYHPHGFHVPVLSLTNPTSFFQVLGLGKSGLCCLSTQVYHRLSILFLHIYTFTTQT